MIFSRSVQVALLLIIAGSLPVRAQTALPVQVQSALPVPEVENDDLNGLQLSGPGAISLRASLAGLRANPDAEREIKAWVARGNVVFLHTDAAQSFGFTCAALRPTTPAQGGQEWVRTRAALPFGAHPLLRGDNVDASSANVQSGDATRLPSVSRVFGSLRDGDALVVASDVATPLLRVEDVTGNNSPVQFAAAMTSLGAGWAIFCPDEIDDNRGDGALFLRALAGFVPGVSGQRWIGIPTRVLTSGTLSSLAGAVDARLSAANASNGKAALPAFGTNVQPVQAPPLSEPTLPIEREEAASLLLVLQNGGVRARARVALMQARLALQNGDALTCASALEVASVDPALGAQIDFWNAALNAQLGADWSLSAPQRASLFDLSARALAQSVALSDSSSNVARAQNAVPFSVSSATMRVWSQKMARLSAIAALSPPLVRTLVAGQSSASIRFFAGDPNQRALESSVAALLRDVQFGWRVPHVEIVLLPSSQNFFALRRAMGRGESGFSPDGDQGGNTILLASGAANAATLRRLWSRVLLATWSDNARPLPPWLVIGFEGVALGGNSPAARSELGRAARANTVSLFDEASEIGATPFGRARSTALIEWLYARFGVGAGSELVARLAAGRPLEQALSDATGETLEDLDSDWRRFLGS